MSKKVSLWLSTAVLLLVAGGAHALVTCSVSAPNISTTYNSAVLNIIPITATVTCNKVTDKNKSNVSYQLAAVELAPLSQALSGGNALTYSLAADPACTTLWNATNLLPTLIVKHSIAPDSQLVVAEQASLCIPAGQAPPLGTYTDTITMNFVNTTVTGDTFVFIPSVFNIAITMPTTCVVTTPPGSVSFAYTAFSADSAFANTSFGLTCTDTLPYSIALDTTVGVVSGLSYTIGLSTTTLGGTGSVSSSGTGIAQTFYVNGEMAAGQPGSCATASCTDSRIHTLTITY